MEYEDNPEMAAGYSGLINQEDSLLVDQAAELLGQIPGDMVTAGEYLGLGLASQNAYKLIAAERYFQQAYDVAASRADFNLEIGALRNLANHHFLMGFPSKGRDEYRKAMEIFGKYPSYNHDNQTVTKVETLNFWAIAEMSFGDEGEARRHLDRAQALVDALPDSPGAEQLQGLLSQTKDKLVFFGPSPAQAGGIELFNSPAP